MNENEVGRKIAAQLDQALVELPPSVVRKLQAARLTAVSAHRPVQGWHARPGHALSAWLFGRGLGTRLVLPAAIVLASVTGLIYWQMSNQHEDELDTGLLAGELPLHAYTDPGFETWLKHSAYTQPQR
ncbi:MAG TPA: DUF3619 family protein [Burkholderiales bacterium]|nr:DUF3619 family protein [Burkholderiales bacterium]